MAIPVLNPTNPVHQTPNKGRKLKRVTLILWRTITSQLMTGGKLSSISFASSEVRETVLPRVKTPNWKNIERSKIETLIRCLFLRKKP